MGYVVDLTNSLNIKASFINGGDTPIIPTPDYDLTELEQQLHDDAIARLNLVNPNHRYMAFGFITDLHESYDGVGYGGPLITSKPSLKLLSAIAKTYNLDGVFFGGDYSLGDGLSYEQYDAALRDLSDRVNASFTVPHFATEGNHDRWKSGNANNHCRGNTAWKRFLTGFNTPNMAVFPTRNDSENGYIANTYYVDFSKYKVRVVMRSEYEKQESIGIPVGNSEGAGHFQNNLEDCLTFDNPSVARNWTALCISHYSLNGLGKNGNSSLNKFFSGSLNNHIAGKAVVGELFGHVHDNWPVLKPQMSSGDGNLIRLGQTHAFAEDLISPTNPSTRVEYTNNDYRFSLYVIDTNNFNLHVIEVGMQYNRTGNPYYNSNTRIFSYPFRHNNTVPTENTFKFLHFSDPHRCTDAIYKCKELMEENSDIKCTILTGDFANIAQENNINSTTDTALKEFGHNLLVLNGNHEIWDCPAYMNQSYLQSVITVDNVVWGKENPNLREGGYYYVDYAINSNSTLRLICIDQYQLYKYFNNSSNGTVPHWKAVYSQDEIDWFITALSDLTSNDYVLIALHEPPITGNYGPELRRLNDFCTANVKSFNDNINAGNVIPLIVNCYLKKQAFSDHILNFVYEDDDTKTDKIGLNIDVDFTNITPCTFLGYLCGHEHGDIHCYHPKYPDQLIMCIDWANDASNNRVYWSDIYNTSAPHRKDGVLINEVTLDFDARKTIIKRIGNGSGEDGYGVTTSGKARTTIAFPFTEPVN